MVQIIAMVKPFRAQAVLAALESVEISGGRSARRWATAGRRTGSTAISGASTTRRSCPRWRSPSSSTSDDAAAAVRAIVGQARTGRIGDGKILILPCLDEHRDW